MTILSVLMLPRPTLSLSLLELRKSHGSLAGKTPAEPIGERIDVTPLRENVAEACKPEKKPAETLEPKTDQAAGLRAI